jgi:hypothetical protein
MVDGEPEKRWQEGHGYKTQRLMLNAIIKYGWDNIEHEILYSGLKKKEAEIMEKELIKKSQSYKCAYGYNIFIGNRINELSEEDMKDSNTLECLINHIKSSQTRKPVMCVETGKIYLSMSQVQKEFGMSHAAISCACKYGCIANGYHWKYVEDVYN